MKQIVFLAGSFYPNFSAVGYCAYQVQKCLSEEFEITVIAFKNGADQPLEEVVDGIRIVRVETDAMRRRNALSGASGRVARWRLMSHRVFGALKRLFAPETIDRRLVATYDSALKALNFSPNAIVPLVLPFESAIAALQYKRTNPTAKLIPYLFDNFVESGSLHVTKLARSLKRGRHIRLEHQVLTESDAVMAMHPLHVHYQKHFDFELLRKVTVLEHPLLVRPGRVYANPNNARAATRLCFTGSLIRGYVEADYLLRVLAMVQVQNQTCADFYVMGNGASKIETGTSPGGIAVHNRGRVAKPVADAAVRDADILLNIGEVQGKQISSKIFEYMATGKPLIHFSYTADDVVTRILNKYPLALCILQDEALLSQNAKAIADFITTQRGVQLLFSEVAALYPEALPATTANMMRSLFRDEI